MITKPFKNSSQTNVYSTTQAVDAHHHSLHMTLNNMFTAGGLCALVFACIYGMTDKEMPKDGIVMKCVEGLVAGSDMIGSTQEEGFLVFIRGDYEPNDEVEVEVQYTGTSPLTDLPNLLQKCVEKLKLQKFTKSWCTTLILNRSEKLFTK